MKDNFVGTTTITTEEYLGMRADIEHLMSVIDSYKDDDKVIVINRGYCGDCIVSRYQVKGKEGVITSLTNEVEILKTALSKEESNFCTLERKTEKLEQQLKAIEDKKLKNRIKNFLAE